MFFRSEEMRLFELRLTTESAWSTLNVLGLNGIVQIEDSNKDLQTSNRPYVHQSKRCVWMLERIDFIKKLIDRMGEQVVSPPGDFRVFHRIFDHWKSKREFDLKNLDHLENEINNKYILLKDNNENLTLLTSRLLLLEENLMVFSEIHSKIPHSFGFYSSDDDISEFEVNSHSLIFRYICGVLDSEDAGRFQKMVFRITRGRVFVKLIQMSYENYGSDFSSIIDEEDKAYFLSKTVTLIAFQSTKADTVKHKLMRMCDAFGMRRYHLPNSQVNYEEERQRIISEIEYLREIKRTTTRKIIRYLKELTNVEKPIGCSIIEIYRLTIIKEKCIYENLDKMKQKDGILFADVWIAKQNEGYARKQLSSLSGEFNFVCPELELKNWKYEKNLKPPTHFHTNDLTLPFMEIVETYGIPRYREANPSPWLISTFPYQFGVMFGDVGHGGILFLIGATLIIKYQQLKEAGVSTKVLQLRYMLFLMGFFSLYCGFIYNEMFAVPLQLFQSCYEEDSTSINEDCTYPFGLDSAWYFAKNEISFFNSFKMKLSIIIGVLHMMLGIAIKVTNNLYSKNFIELFFEALPQMVFISCTFGYMCFCIVVKWLQSWEGKTPPPILNVFTNLGVTVYNCLF